MSIIGTVLLLATESEGGFGLNLDILETNIVNLGLLIGILFYFGRNVLTNTLIERRSKIEKTIMKAETKAKEAAIFCFHDLFPSLLSFSFKLAEVG